MNTIHYFDDITLNILLCYFKWVNKLQLKKCSNCASQKLEKVVMLGSGLECGEIKIKPQNPKKAKFFDLKAHLFNRSLVQVYTFLCMDCGKIVLWGNVEEFKTVQE